MSSKLAVVTTISYYLFMNTWEQIDCNNLLWTDKEHSSLLPVLKEKELLCILLKKKNSFLVSKLLVLKKGALLFIAHITIYS